METDKPPDISKNIDSLIIIPELFGLSDSVARKIVFCLFLLYTTAYSLLSVLRHTGFNSASFDLAIIDQTIWNTSQGRLFETTLEMAVRGKNYLGIHFSPILLLFAPLYWVWDNVIYSKNNVVLLKAKEIGQDI